MSYRVWEQRYAFDPSIVGSSFVIDGSTFTIAGIAPPGFFGDAVRQNPPDFWLPLKTEPAVHGKQSVLQHKDDHWLYIIGRLKPNTAIGPLEPRANVALRQWVTANMAPQTAQDRKDSSQVHVAVVPAGGGVSVLNRQFGGQLRLLWWITAAVLLIACANLANLQLSRGAARAAQMSVRAALGAPWIRLVRQTLVESTLLAVAGGLAGLVLANWLTALLISLTFRDPRSVPVDAAPSGPVLAFAFALSLVTGFVFGIIPAWSSSRADPADALRAAGRSTGGRETLSQRLLVVFQTALSLALVAAAGMMILTLRNLTTQDFGIAIDNRVGVQINTALTGSAPEKIASVYSQIRARIAAIPGVAAESMALYGPLEDNNWQTGTSVEEHPGQIYQPSWDRVSTGFFDVIGAKLIRGRAFNAGDTPNSTHVAVVNRTFAEQIFPGEEAIGKRFGMGGPAHAADYQIVGVIENARFRNPRQPVNAMFFIPMLQMSGAEWNNNGLSRSNMAGSIQLRLSNRPADLEARLRQAVSGVDSNVTVLRLSTFAEEMGTTVVGEQLIARLAEGFGALALLLAAIGIYGVMSYSVARRRNEIGIRGALGANRGNIVSLIMRTALGLVLAGVVLGLPVAYAAGRLLGGQLWSVEPLDPRIVGAAAIALVASAAAASLLPALKATAIDPAVALRTE
jgi:predicted permease